LLLARGVSLGFQLPSLRVVGFSPVSTGDTLIFTTDGINTDFDRRLARKPPAAEGCRKAFWPGNGKTTDDALVLVAR